MFLCYYPLLVWSDVDVSTTIWRWAVPHLTVFLAHLRWSRYGWSSCWGTCRIYIKKYTCICPCVVFYLLFVCFPSLSFSLLLSFSLSFIAFTFQAVFSAVTHPAVCCLCYFCYCVVLHKVTILLTPHRLSLHLLKGILSTWHHSSLTVFFC